MKKLFISLLMITLAMQGFSQKISVDVNYSYPLTGVIKDDFTGVVDIGLKYRLYKAPVSFVPLSFGAALNASLLSGKMDSVGSTNAIKITPEIYAALNLLVLTPYVGIGYSFLQFTGTDASELKSLPNGGVTFNAGLKYHVFPLVYLNLGYDFTKYAPSYGNPNNLNFVYAGLGIGL